MEPKETLNFEDVREVIRPRIVRDAVFEEMVGDSTEDNLFSKINEHSEKTRGEYTEPEALETEEVPEETEETEEDKSFIDGRMLLYMVNLAIPNLLWLIYQWVPQLKKSFTFDKKVMALDDEEREMVQDSSDEVARILFGKLTPVQQFLIGMGVIYSMKLPEAFKAKDKQDEK